MSKIVGKLVWTKCQDGGLVAGPLPRNYWKKRDSVPPWSLEAKARVAEADGQKVVAKILRLYSCRPVDFEYIATNEDMLDEVGLIPEDVTPVVLAHANRLLRESNEQIKNMTLDLGGTWNGIGRRSLAEEYLEEEKKATSKRTKLFGYPITSILRWMGKEKWSFQEARNSMDALEVDVADATIRAQLRAGKLGERGEPADLTEEQINSLYETAQ